MSCFKPTELLINPVTDEPILVYSNNFSYKYVPYGCCLILNEYQEMILKKELKLDGNLKLDGDIYIIN